MRGVSYDNSLCVEELQGGYLMIIQCLLFMIIEHMLFKIIQWVSYDNSVGVADGYLSE